MRSGSRRRLLCVKDVVRSTASSSAMKVTPCVIKLVNVMDKLRNKQYRPAMSAELTFL
jgi:hypothetical protein